MAWGKSGSRQPSTLGQLVPLLIVLVILGAIAWVGYQIYLSVAQIQAQATKKMGKKNVVFTKDGVRVGVKHVENEQYVDKTQSWVVKAWNLADNGGAKTPTDVKKRK
ncbi:uncharacterized protein E0L32_009221 [Thyridium curvatum]|uniref:Uncharacterized protein n=1 Tax=Thyridium curvatum TaxID=1093900 RepID=A0A507AZG2_9PEZI|nr:uncharacterized protein E0L32_009221 [Thyridium curvatum]TPX09620.1 hypothetical protein E0L32_009221 [Thyridium curvatum]